MKTGRPISGRQSSDVNETSLPTKTTDKGSKALEPQPDNRRGSGSPLRTEGFDSPSPVSDRKSKLKTGPELEDDPFQGLLSGKDGHRPRTGRNKRYSIKDEDEVEHLEYNVRQSSISSEQPPSRPSSGSVASLSSSDSSKVTQAPVKPSSRHGQQSTHRNSSPSAPGSRSKKPSQRLGDVDFGDLDDLENNVNDLDLGPRLPMRQPSFVVDSKPIDQQTAVVSIIFHNCV